MLRAPRRRIGSGCRPWRGPLPWPAAACAPTVAVRPDLAALRLPREARLYPWLGLGGCLFLTPFLPVRIWITGIALIAAGLVWRVLAARLWPINPAKSRP